MDASIFRAHRKTVVASAISGMLLASRALATTAGSAPVPEAPVAWGPCPASWVGAGHGHGPLRDRLECGSMRAPYDHTAPDGRLMDIGVIRVRAGIAAQREGSIFLHPGGPGDPPGQLLASIARSWAGTGAGDSKRQLSDRFDLVAVIPRGLVGSTPIRCITGLPPPYGHVPTHLDPINWELMIAEATSVARACTTPGHGRYINTEQYVHDMDMLRRALGDSRIHMYALSYGGMSAAWYASMYPEHTGRMLLDSSMDFTGDFVSAIRLSMMARHFSIIDDVLVPLLDDTVRYGLVDDAQVVISAIAALPSRIQEVWPWTDSGVQLAAALHVAPLWRDGRPPTLDAMAARIREVPAIPDTDLGRQVRSAALRLAGRMYEPARIQPIYEVSAESDSVRLIVSCNDMSGTRTDDEILQLARDDASRYWSYTGDETMEELICSRWGGTSARRPNLSNLAQATPFLLLQSEKDLATPPDGARRIFERFGNARMLLVRDSDLHGLFNFTRSFCLEDTAANYLLTGVIPASPSRLLACDGSVGNGVPAIPTAPHASISAPVPVIPVDPPSSDRDEL